MKSWMLAGFVVACATTSAFGQDYNGGAFCQILGPGPDVTLCELYDFGSTQRVNGGAWNGVASAVRVGTTSWNVGSAQLLWEQMPDPDHPKITMNIYRLMDGRFENIANHWVKHGYFALSDQQCSDAALGLCQGTNGTRLGLACTDTYSPSLNATTALLGPRYEVNPWSGTWSFSGSVFDIGGPSAYLGVRQLQVHDNDVSLVGNPGARYFAEGFYCTGDDICVYNSAAYKELFITAYQPDGRPIFVGESDRDTPPHQSFAMLAAWDKATLTEIAEQMPVIENVSPDGRAVVGAHVTDLGGGLWRYDYTVMNIDMDRQIDQFWVDLPAGVTASNLYFHAPMLHEEIYTYHNGGMSWGPPRDNDPWVGVIEADKVRWSTDAHDPGTSSNPIGWATAYSFGFTADTAPTTGTMGVTAYKPGAAGPITGATRAPSAGVNCPGDIDGNLIVNLDDLQDLLFSFGSPYSLDDLQVVLFNFGNDCTAP